MKFPFTTALGAGDMACVLSLAGISPEIDGVLVRGEKGTAESTMVRALTDVVRSDLQAEGVA
jgi:magnesium chelatase